MERPEVTRRIDPALVFMVCAAAVACLVGAALTGFEIGKDRLPDTIPACTSEDSVELCWWDAKVAGNGTGVSFLVDADGHVHYLKGGN